MHCIIIYLHLHFVKYLHYLLPLMMKEADELLFFPLVSEDRRSPLGVTCAETRDEFLGEEFGVRGLQLSGTRDKHFL